MKALSTILGTVILIALVVVVYAIVSTFSTQLIKDETSATSQRTQDTVQCTFSHVTIQDVYIDRLEDVARVYVMNQGQTDEEILAATVVNRDGERRDAQGVPRALGESNITSIEVDITDFITACDQFSYAEIVTSCATITSDDAPVC